MTDFMLQASTRQDVLDDLGSALPLETWIGPFTFDGGGGDIQHIYGSGDVNLKGPEFSEWMLLIVWHDSYSSAIPGGKIDRGLHANIRPAGDRAEEIAGLIQAFFRKQAKSTRKWADDRVWQSRDKRGAGDVLMTARGTCWLQGDDPAGDGYVKHQSFVFG